MLWLMASASASEKPIANAFIAGGAELKTASLALQLIAEMAHRKRSGINNGENVAYQLMAKMAMA